MNNNEEQLKLIIKNDPITKGIKIWDPAIEHLEHLLRFFNNPNAGDINAIRFYMMGFAAGVQSRAK